MGIATMEASYAITRVFAALVARGIEAIMPTTVERPPRKCIMPVRRFKFDAKHGFVRCVTGTILRAHGKPGSRGFQPSDARIAHCEPCRPRARRRYRPGREAVVPRRRADLEVGPPGGASAGSGASRWQSHHLDCARVTASRLLAAQSREDSVNFGHGSVGVLQRHAVSGRFAPPCPHRLAQGFRCTSSRRGHSSDCPCRRQRCCRPVGRDRRAGKSSSQPQPQISNLLV